MPVLKLTFALLYVAFFIQNQSEELPNVLFYSDPQQSDNHIIRRTEPDVLSAAEKQFAEISKGIFNVTITQDPSEVSHEKLNSYDVVVFFTAINPPVDKEALVEWVKNGGAFVAIHSTANTFKDYAPFGEMLGAYFDSRPWRTKEKPLEQVRILVEDTSHPSTNHLGEAFEIVDDLYLYDHWDRSKFHVLLRMDPSSLDMTKVKQKTTDMPIAWTKMYGKGRVFYTMLGDSEPVWNDSRYRTHLIEGIRWTMGN